VKADGENDDIQESEPKDEVDTDESNKTDESDNSDNILTLHGEEEESEDEDEAEKKPTVEELFGAPASRYFGEPTEEPEEDSERESPRHTRPVRRHGRVRSDEIPFRADAE